MPFSSNAEQRAKRAEDYPSIFGSINLTAIRENIGEILKLIGRDGIFREYTLHDVNHIDAMLALVDKLIPSDTASPGRWTRVPQELQDINFVQDINFGRGGRRSVWITGDPAVSAGSPEYDVVYWRGWCLVLAPSKIHRLLDALGMNKRFARWLSTLLRAGEIPLEDRATLKDQLVRAKGGQGEELMAGLALPFDRRFGEGADRRGDHLFSGE
jgi:hypothetical protein